MLVGVAAAVRRRVGEGSTFVVMVVFADGPPVALQGFVALARTVVPELAVPVLVPVPVLALVLVLVAALVVVASAARFSVVEEVVAAGRLSLAAVVGDWSLAAMLAVVVAVAQPTSEAQESAWVSEWLSVRYQRQIAAYSGEPSAAFAAVATVVAFEVGLTLVHAAEALVVRPVNAVVVLK